jgi:hypothetical protein
MKRKWLYSNILSFALVIIGVVLLSLTLKYRVNPVEGSVVDPNILGTSLHYILLPTTMPAWIAGESLASIISFKHNLELAVTFMYLFQILEYYFLGTLIYFIIRLAWNHCSK